MREIQLLSLENGHSKIGNHDTVDLIQTALQEVHLIQVNKTINITRPFSQGTGVKQDLGGVNHLKEGGGAYFQSILKMYPFENNVLMHSNMHSTF